VVLKQQQQLSNQLNQQQLSNQLNQQLLKKAS
jgi:hypothetical protein